MTQEMYERSPVRVLAENLDGGLQPGQVGFVIARSGVGKSALLVHLALERLMRGQAVLHVALNDAVDHVRQFYDQVFRASARTGNAADRASAMVAAERHRMIHSYAHRAFSAEHLESTLSMLRDVAAFEPALIVVDGLDGDGVESIGDLVGLARSLGLPIWVTIRASARYGDVTPALWEHASLGLRLTPEGRSVAISLLQGAGKSVDLPVRLDPATMVVLDADGDAGSRSLHSPTSTDCTLYSGGANGSEAAFGEIAGKWNVHEVNFTFQGHKQVRSQGSYELSPRELAAGDVSLVYVSRRLNRTYSQGSLIRKVLQTLWHMVSRSQQVFVVGKIQEDGTVIGGTGWSVELARMWNKSLWVFDQERLGWFRWDGHDWSPGMPVIESVHFCGTGTRYLTDEGRQAIEDLFERSFA